MPPAKRPVDVALPSEDAWSASTVAKRGIDQAWLKRFKDRQLLDLVQAAVAHHPDLKGAAARVRQAAGAARLAASAGRPQLNATLTGNRRKTNFIGFPDFGGFGAAGGGSATPEVLSTISDSFGASLDLSWEIDLWGRIRAAESSALAEWQAAEADFRAARTSLAAQVAKAWFALTEAAQQRALAEETVATFQKTEDVIADRFEIGEVDGGGTGAQLRLAKADTASAREQLAARENQLRQARRQIEVLLGRYPKNALQERLELPQLPSPPPAGLPSELLVRRPDIQAAERRYASQGERVKEARLARFPKLALTASGGTSTEALQDILNSDFGVWNLAGNLAQPILTGGRLRTEEQIRRDQESQTLAHLQSTVLQAFLEVELALEADEFLAEREAAITEAAALANEADVAARADYRDGVGDILTVLAAQSRALQFSGQRLSLRRLRLDNRVNLHLALGGDF